MLEFQARSPVGGLRESIRKKISFTKATRKIRYLGINLTKEVKDLYSEKYTTLKEEIKEDTNKWKHIYTMFMDWKN